MSSKQQILHALIVLELAKAGYEVATAGAFQRCIRKIEQAVKPVGRVERESLLPTG